MGPDLRLQSKPGPRVSLKEDLPKERGDESVRSELVTREVGSLFPFPDLGSRKGILRRRGYVYIYRYVRGSYKGRNRSS